MELVRIVFSGLSALVIEDVEDAGAVIRVRARSQGGPVACPGCGAETGRVHGYHQRTLGDVPVDGRRVVVTVRGRGMRCPVLGCPRETFREQVPGVLELTQVGGLIPDAWGRCYAMRLLQFAAAPGIGPTVRGRGS
jgi:hypothetical protein